MCDGFGGSDGVVCLGMVLWYGGLGGFGSVVSLGVLFWWVKW